MAFVINSPTNLILSQVTTLAVLLVFIIVGLPNFLHLRKFIIDTSEPELSCNLMLLLNIWTCSNFQMFWPSDSSVLAIFTKLFFFSALQCVLLCPNRSQIGHFLSLYGQSLYQCNGRQPKHSLGGKILCFFFFLGLPDSVGNWFCFLYVFFFFFFFFCYVFFNKIHRFPQCLSDLGEHKQNFSSLRRFVTALN